PDLVEKRPDLLGREVVPRKSRLQVLLQCKLDGNTEASRYGDADLSQESRQRPVVPVKGLIESAGVLERRIQQNAHDLLLLVSKQQTQRIHLAAEMTVHGADQIRHVLAAEQLQDLAFHIGVSVRTQVRAHAAAHVMISKVQHAIGEVGVLKGNLRLDVNAPQPQLDPA